MKASSGGIGTTAILTIVFVVLKLSGIIAWPWVWVLSPLWIGGGLGIAAMLIVLVVIMATANGQRKQIGRRAK